MKYEKLTRIDKLVLGGLISAGISMQFLPSIFAILGILLGSIAFKEGAKTKGTVVILVSVIFGVLGLIITSISLGPFSVYNAFLRG